MAFTKIVGAGIHTLSNVNTHNINSSGIITATKFTGLFDGSSGDFSGNVTIDGNLTVNGTTTKLDTALQEVDQLFVDANNSTVGVAITQSGTGDILNLYDGSSEVFSVADGGAVTATGNVTISKQNAVIELSDPDSSDANYQIRNDNGTFDIQDSTNSTVKIRAASSYVTVFPNLNANNGLDVMGTITGDGNLDIADSIRHSGNVNTKITFPENNTISFDTAGSERLRITPGGKVGIGTTNPSAELDIEGEQARIHLHDYDGNQAQLIQSYRNPPAGQKCYANLTR